jgi:hypothetical protein
MVRYCENHVGTWRDHSKHDLPDGSHGLKNWRLGHCRARKGKSRQPREDQHIPLHRTPPVITICLQANIFPEAWALETMRREKNRDGKIEVKSS